MKPIHKFNNGNGATLCYSCRTIIDRAGMNDHLLCPKCQEKAVKQLKELYQLIRMEGYHHNEVKEFLKEIEDE